MARKQAIPTNEEIQKRFEKCYGFNNQIGLYDQVKGRSPHGERGLKYVQAIYQRFPKKLSNPLN